MRKFNQRTHTKTKAAQALAASTQDALSMGLVVATPGRHCVVELDDGARIICHPRGKKSQAVVGDRVRWQAAADEGTIESVVERKNLFYRKDEVRTKSFAANLDQVLILLGAEPEFSETQLSRALIAAEAEHIKPLIVLNKSDGYRGIGCYEGIVIKNEKSYYIDIVSEGIVCELELVN